MEESAALYGSVEISAGGQRCTWVRCWAHPVRPPMSSNMTTIRIRVPIHDTSCRRRIVQVRPGEGRAFSLRLSGDIAFATERIRFADAAV
jgi:hypothetical protein